MRGARECDRIEMFPFHDIGQIDLVYWIHSVSAIGGKENVFAIVKE